MQSGARSGSKGANGDAKELAARRGAVHRNEVIP